jgi:predicted metal-dependent enzyme (double-stranded beta helix superfamily)
MTHTAAFTRFIEDVRLIVHRDDNAARVGSAVAELLQPLLGREELLNAEQYEADSTRYRQHILHVEPDGSFSIVALVWLPGQATCIHDHVSWCVVGVHAGQENETQYCVADDHADPHLVVCGRTVNPAGSVAALVPPGDIHDVANGGETLAVSLHVYGANIATLGSSIRRRYDLPVRPAA